MAKHLDSHAAAIQLLGEQEQDVLDRQVQALAANQLTSSVLGLTIPMGTTTAELNGEPRNEDLSVLATDPIGYETVCNVEKERKIIAERRMDVETALKQDIITIRKLAADASEEQNKEIQLRCLRELTEMRHHIDDQESELTNQRELLREQRRAIDVETPRMRQKHLEEINRVSKALQERENELDDARRKLESHAQAQLAEVKAVKAKYAQRIREEARREALADMANQKEGKLAQHAQEIDNLRLALDAKEKSLKAQKISVMMQQARARTMPIAHRWVQKQKLRTLQRKVENEAQAIAVAKKALATEAAKELEKMNKLAQDELKRQRDEMAQLHLQDLDAANERIQERERELDLRKEHLQLKQSQLLEHNAPHARDKHMREIATLQAEIEDKEEELNVQRTVIQTDAAAEIEAVKESARVAAEVAQMEMEKRIEAELLGQRLEMEATMRKQRKEMERQTNLLLEEQTKHLHDLAAARIDKRAGDVQGYRNEVMLISEERRDALDQHAAEVERLREKQVQKLEHLNEAADAEKARMQEKKRDLETRLARAVSDGKGKGKSVGQNNNNSSSSNNSDQVNKIRDQLKTTITEIQNISQDHQASLSSLRAQASLEQAQERERHAKVMEQLSKEASTQIEGMDEAMVDLDDVHAKEEISTKEEVQHVLDDMREKHIAYIAKMENLIAEREHQVVAARDRHIAEQERMHRDRERDLQNALREVASRESSLQSALREKQNSTNTEQTKQM